jgi:hypothetical protein
MNIGWGLVVIILASLAWVGQTIAWLAPRHAERWGLTEREESVEPAYHADIRGEAAWDAFTLWTLVVAGVLLVLDHAAWPYFGLIGGGTYLYFAGRGVLTRRAMQRRGLRIGDPNNVRIGYLFLVIWGVVAAITIVASAIALAGR